MIKLLLKYRYLSLLVAIVTVALSAGVAYSFSNHWSTHFSGGSSDFSQWKKYKIGACSGQKQSISNSQVHMAADYGTDCFGAYYRENNSTPNAFPLDSDIRVMWQWRYPNYELYGSQAGQLTSAYGVIQYYGMSGVDTKQVGGPDRDAHVLTDGAWGRNTVDNPLWRSGDNDHNWHTSTFDFICDGRELTWWLDDRQLKRITNGTARGANDPYRPYQFWFGNLLTSVPDEGDWSAFDLEYLYIYKVERPQMNPPAAGSGGAQPVSWTGVANTPQPDGSTWGIEYQVQACANSNCGTVVSTAPWQAGTSHTFTGLTPNTTYYYRVRARWVGTPALTTCWSGAVPALMAGEADLELEKNGPAQVMAGGPINYSLILRSTGDTPAQGVVVEDPIPQYVLNPAQISHGGSVQGNKIVWNLGTVNSGQSVSLSWQGTVDPQTPLSVTQIRNSATGRDSAGHTDQDDATTAILKPVMELEKAAPAWVWPGGPVVYTLTVRSAGNTALAGVVIRDPVPPYVTHPTQISHGGSAQGGAVVWNLGTIPPGQSVTLTWQGTVDPTIPATQPEIPNLATGTAEGGITRQAQASSQVGFPEIAVDKAGPVEAAPGEVIDYLIAVQNLGSGPATDVTIRDTVPAYVLSPTNIGSGGVLQGNEIVWTVAAINPGETVTLSWQGTVDPDIPLTQNDIVNTASACDRTGGCDTAMATTRIMKPAVSLTKNATSHVYPHGLVQYEIIVENSGETVLKEVVVKDPLPEYVLNPRHISHGGVADASPFEGKIEMVWRLAELAPGEVIILTWEGTVAPFTPETEVAIRNVATVTSPHATAQAEAASYLLHPRILLRKSATVMAGPGDNILYTLTVENHSWAPAYGVEVHDPIPDHIINQRNATEGGEVRAEEIFWSFDLLQPRESRTLMWEGTVDPAIPATLQQIANTATAFDGMGHRDEAQAVTLLPGQTLYAYKTSSYIVWPGGEIDYSIVIQNVNQASLEQVVVRDPVPAYIGYPREISHGGVFEGNSDVVWQLNRIAPGEAVVLTWRGTVDPALPQTQTTLSNEASIAAGGGLTATVRTKSYVDFPVLALYKISTPARVGPGEPISYTVMVENIGDVPALNLVVSDLIPELVQGPANISEGGVIETIPAGQIVWKIPALLGGERRLLSWEGTVDVAAPASLSQITNTVTVKDLSGLQLQAQATTPILRPGLALTKTGPAELLPGQEVAYSLTVANTGQTTLRQVSVVDAIPPYLLNPTSIGQGGLISGGHQIVWPVGDLLPGARLDLTWQATLDKATPAQLDTLTNQAAATAWPGVQALAAATSTVVKPNLAVMKRGPAGIRPGDIVDYEIEVINQGRTTVYQLAVTDLIPRYLSPHHIDGDYELAGNTIRWAGLGDLVPGQRRTLSWQAQVDPALPNTVSLVRNVAVATGLGGLTVEGAVESPVLEAGLAITKAATGATYPGGEVDYTLRLVNQGPGLARQVEVRDPVPGFVDYLAGSASQDGQFDAETGALVWQFDQLQPGQALDLTWRGQVESQLPEAVKAIINEVSVSSIDEPSPMTATAITAILEPVVEIQPSCPPFSQAGDRVAYRVSLHNVGAGPLVDAVVRAPVGPGLSYVPGSATAGGQLIGQALSWDLGVLAAGATAELAFELQVDPAATAEQIVTAVNFYAGTRQVGQSSCPTGLTAPELSLAKLAPAQAYVNDVVEYTIVISNPSPVTAHNTVISDTLAPGVTYVPDADGSDLRDGVLTWRLGDLAAGESQSVRFKAQLAIPADFGDFDESGAARLYNEAVASADRARPVRAEAIILTPRPVLTLTRTALTNSQVDGAALYGAVTRADSPTILMAKVVLSDGGQATELMMAADPAAIPGGQPAVVPAVQVGPGDLISHTLIGGSSGPGVARQAVLKEWVPAGLVVLEETISHGGAYDPDDHAVIWPLGDLAPGQQLRRFYTLLAPVGMRPGRVELEDNLAFISSPDAATVYANATTLISGSFRMSGLKSATAFARPGDLIDYTIRVQNVSPNLLDQVVITDPLPDYTTYLEHSATPAVENGGRTLVWNLGMLRAGEVREVRFKVRLAYKLPDVIGRIFNRAQVTFSGGQMFELQAVTQLPAAQLEPTPTPEGEAGGSPDPAVPPAATPLPGRPPVVSLPPGPSPTPALLPGLVKSVSPAVVKAGQISAVTWRLTFTNPTSVTIKNLTLRDLLPEGIAYLSSSASQGTITTHPLPVQTTTGVIHPGQAPTPGPALPPQVAGFTQLLTPTQAVTSSPAAWPTPAGTPVNLPPRTELVVAAGDVPPHSQVEIIIQTSVISASRELAYVNVATYSAANLEPGSSNEARLGVEGWFILPVTGSLLDPRTPQGRVAWSGLVLAAALVAIGWRRRARRRLELKSGA